MVLIHETGVECYAILGRSVATEPIRIPASIRFGENFEFDPHAYRLSRSGRVLKLERIPAEVLAVLVEQRGQVVTRQQIVDRIWGKGAFLDTDNSINGAVRKIRHVLKDDSDHPKFIQTVTGKGYRFIAPVIDVDVPRPVAVLNRSSPIPAPVIDKPARWPWAILLALAIVLIAVPAIYRWSRLRVRPVSADGRVMLAVLPFENLTGDASQDYFSDGMTEEMIAQLGDVDPQHLGVIARTSVMPYKHSTKALNQIGRELGVQYALEGSVRRDSDKMRITAQLIQIRDQSPLWLGQYDRELNSLLVIQGEIAQQIADEIQLKIGDRGRINSLQRVPLSPASAEAHQLYLKGRYFWNKRTARDLQQAIAYFQQAVDKDPSDARAYAGLAEAYALMSGYSDAPATASMSKARVAAQRALQLDERLPEAHTALAVIAQDYDWDWPTAEKEYRRAIHLNPNYATGHHWYAECLALQGRFNEAFPEIESARQLDPLSLIIATDYGAILYFSRQYDRAIAQFRGVLEMEPNFPRAHMLISAYAQKGLFADALADAQGWHSPDERPWILAMETYASGRSGDQVKAKLALEQMQRLRQYRAVDPLAFAVAYIGMGSTDKAMGWLEKAYQERSSSLTALKVDPIYDPLRTDPRFQALLHRVGLGQN